MVRPPKFSEIEKKRNCGTGVRIKNARIKESGFHLTSKQIFLITIMLLIFMGSGIGYVWSNFEGTQIGYDISRLNREVLELEELNLKLRLELATLKSPQYLEERTLGSGLRETRPGQIVILE